MKKEALFSSLWKDYVNQTPSALKIHKLLEQQGETVYNDHIALRTVNIPEVGIDKLSTLFIEAGYIEKDSYSFEEKKLNAKHYEHKTDINAPKVFISELILEEFSEELQNIIKGFISLIPKGIIDLNALLVSGRTWGTISYNVYEALRNESEYAAWLYVFGFCANHFTINVNALKTIDDLTQMNTFLKDHSFKMNNSGGEIKGNQSLLLEQSSILADKIEIEFMEGKYKIPSCYYEFAKRYEDGNGNLFKGFVSKSADKIFESTNMDLAIANS